MCVRQRWVSILSLMSVGFSLLAVAAAGVIVGTGFLWEREHPTSTGPLWVTLMCVLYVPPIVANLVALSRWLSPFHPQRPVGVGLLGLLSALVSYFPDDGYAQRDWGAYLLVVRALAVLAAVVALALLALHVVDRLSRWYAALPEPE